MSRSDWDDEEKPVNPRKGGRARFDEWGERIPPIHKPFKRSQCQWVPGVGWIANPGQRWINWGRG